jgi:hypothetical protein
MYVYMYMYYMYDTCAFLRAASCPRARSSGCGMLYVVCCIVSVVSHICWYKKTLLELGFMGFMGFRHLPGCGRTPRSSSCA